MNSLHSLYTTKITCMHSSYTPPLCHAQSYVYQLMATENIKCTSTKLNFLSISNICCRTKIYSSRTQKSKNTILFFLFPLHFQGLFKQNEEFKTNYFNGSDVLPPTFLSQLKTSVLFLFSSFTLMHC
jgi:hypothetical protein